MTGKYDLPPDSPGFAAAQAEMAERSLPAASLPGAAFDIDYGPHPRHRLDIISAGADAPVLLFFRGGYWKVGNKEERRFPALAWQPRGITWAVPNYRLAPDATLPEIVDDAVAVFNWLTTHAGNHGINGDNIHLIDNSAGAHLCAMIAASTRSPAIKSMTLVSGLFDLEPLVNEAPNDWLQMNQQTAQNMSPIRYPPPQSIPVTVCCGDAETPAFRAQSRNYFDRLREQGCNAEFFESPGKNHMEIILECGMPDTPVFDALNKHLRADRCLQS